MGKKILVIDDEDDFRRVTALRLETAGYDVSDAADYAQALKTISTNPPDLILLDVMMPEVDGFGVKEILNRDINTASIPVMFLTARSDLSSKLKGFKLGVDDYIIKPFEPEEFLARIDSVLKRKELYDEISMTDAVTGLYNTNFFKKQIHIFFNIAKRYGQPFTLAVIDIDGLKSINDNYGHAAGDCVLKHFGEVSKSVLRQTDIITRYGGDEFTVILPGVDEKQSNRAMERLRQEIDNKVLSCEEVKGTITYSISVGVAEYNGSIKDENEMFKLADARMYQEKKLKIMEREKGIEPS